ncbi:uncharacterized protein LOC110892973 [Helianthus annuus]|uniref:uncharacterized protein LOC110892973 n=1 Tax=Helianthus annuus TaxID=4232 RepID=UPI000B90862D|nr:uncharacterized protein LOC110892973 [Helianthus annuus]
MAGEQPVNTGIVQVLENNNTSFQVPRLTSKNYNTWTILMESVLDAQGLWEVIDPVIGDAVDEKKNKVARAVIFQALPEDILLQVAKNRSAKDIWEALRVRFLGADRVQKARLASLRREFEQLRMKETDSIENFAGKISGFVSRYSSLGSSLDDEAIYSDIESMPFEEAIGRLKACEERIKEQDETSDNDQSKVLLSKTDGQTSNTSGQDSKTDGQEKNEESGCKCCGRGWSSQSDRGRGRGRGRGGRYQRDKRFIVCYNCQDKGHYASECPKKESKEEVANLVEEYDPSLF